MQKNNDASKLTATKKAWEKRSKQFGYKAEGVSTKSLPPVINKQLDLWMLSEIESSLKSFIKQKNVKALDLGCGYGRLSKPLLQQFKNLNIHGIDISKTYVDLYNKDLKPRGTAKEADIQNLKFADNYFDLVFIVTTLMYLTNEKDQQKAINEIIRVLKPGGKLVIIERSPSGYYLFTMGGLAGLLRGKKNKEILAVSIDKNRLQEIIKRSGGVLKNISGIPFLSLFLPFSVIINSLNTKMVNFFLKPINALDNKFTTFLWPSLYLSYTVLKPSLKK